MSFVPSQYRLGITAGGQLGKMLAQAAIAWDIPVVVMDDDPACAARQLGMKFLKGNPRFREDLLKLGKEINLLALEIEHVSIEGLFDLQRLRAYASYPILNRLRSSRTKDCRKNGWRRKAFLPCLFYCWIMKTKSWRLCGKGACSCLLYKKRESWVMMEEG